MLLMLLGKWNKWGCDGPIMWLWRGDKELIKNFSTENFSEDFHLNSRGDRMMALRWIWGDSLWESKIYGIDSESYPAAGLGNNGAETFRLLPYFCVGCAISVITFVFYARLGAGVISARPQEYWVNASLSAGFFLLHYCLTNCGSHPPRVSRLTLKTVPDLSRIISNVCVYRRTILPNQ
jgi:hypothetical protein